MRQICPNCQQSVTIPDNEAGKTVPCPACQQPFAIPALFTPTVFEPPPPLPAPSIPAIEAPTISTAPEPTTTATPSTTEEVPSAPPSAAAPSLPEGYTQICSLPLRRAVCHWLSPVCLTLIFILTFFNWVGMYPAGYAAYTQNGWQALFADMSADPVSEKEWKMEGQLNEWMRSSWWLLPYVVLLIIGVLFAWGEPLANRLNWRLPTVVESMWRFRPTLLIACTGITLFFLLVQTAAGFGLDRALHRQVQEKYKEARSDAKTPEEIQKVEMQIAADLGKQCLRTTIWLKLTIVLHIVALAAVIGETLLIHRGDKPPPRIGVMW